MKASSASVWTMAMCLGTAMSCSAAAQLDFPAPVDNPASLPTAMRALASAVIAVYKETDRERYLDNLFRLQLVSGQYADASSTLAALQTLRRSEPARSPAIDQQYRVLADAKLIESQGRTSFDDAFKGAFRRTIEPLDDRTAGILTSEFGADLKAMRTQLRRALSLQKGRARISLPDALALMHTYQVEEAYANFGPLVPALVAEEDRRRYVIQDDLQLKMADGAIVCAFVVRPRAAVQKLPTLLQFTIYADRTQIMNEERRTASNGYAAVEALTRGKGCSPDAPLPYERDGQDGATVIDWISRQPWSDGRVGMYGGSYNSFAQWAAAKHLPPALKTMMVGVPNAPGIDTPMERNVFQSFDYEWPLYTTAGKWLDATSEGDQTRWIDLEKKWYVSGQSYRSMDKIDGQPNPIWDRWLDHPSYDAYWQNLIPYQQEFARVNIPVLVTDGYLAGQGVGGLYYFSQYEKYNPRAEKYLVIGPYDHLRGQFGTTTVLGGEMNVIAGQPIDPAAHINMRDLRYQWFDYIFKGARRPALLKDRVNYEVTGANEWQHAPTIAKMNDRTYRLYLSALPLGKGYRLIQRKPSTRAAISQMVDFADRSDVNRVPPTTGVDPYLSVAFESSPFKRSFDLNGLFGGQLDFIANKRDFDFDVSIYAKTPRGKYVGITYYMARASYVEDAGWRHLLVAGKRTQLQFTASRLTSWRISAGDRIVVLFSIIKEPDIEINYGTGKDVSGETIADARVPLSIKWLNGSFIDIPAH